jgi:hypothetical protein
MPGLLDALFPTPDHAQAMGLLGLGLMRHDPAGGMQGAMQHLAGIDERKLRKGLLESQVEENKAQAAARMAAVAKQAELQKLMGNIFGQGGISAPQVSAGAFAPSADGMGPTLPRDMAGMSAPGSRLAGLGIDQLAALKMNGLDLTDLHKYANDPLKMESGSTYQNRVTGQREYMPRLPEGMAPQGNGVVGHVPGFLNAQTAATFAQEAPKTLLNSAGRVNLRKNPDGTETPVSELTENPTLQNVLQGVFGGRGQAAQPAPQAQTPPQPRPMGPRQPLIQPGDADRQAIYTQEMAAAEARLASAKTPAEVQRAQNDINGLGREMKAAGIGYGKTTAQETAEGARKKYAEGAAVDMVETRKQIVNAGFAAPGTIAKYQQLGKLLEGVDGGTLTATGTQIASTMNSIGIKIDKNLPNKEAAAALGNEMALQLRSPAGGAGMPGALSDKDREFLVGMIPNASQSAQGRKMLINAQIAIEQRKQQVATFARNYEKKHGQLDNGFFDQMQAWSAANSLFGGK